MCNIVCVCKQTDRMYENLTIMGYSFEKSAPFFYPRKVTVKFHVQNKVDHSMDRVHVKWKTSVKIL